MSEDEVRWAIHLVPDEERERKIFDVIRLHHEKVKENYDDMRYAYARYKQEY